MLFHHPRAFVGMGQSTLRCWLYDLSYLGSSFISQDGNKLSVILSLFVFEITNQTKAYTYYVWTPNDIEKFQILSNIVTDFIESALESVNKSSFNI